MDDRVAKKNGTTSHVQDDWSYSIIVYRDEKSRKDVQLKFIQLPMHFQIGIIGRFMKAIIIYYQAIMDNILGSYHTSHNFRVRIETFGSPTRISLWTQI